MLNFSKYIKHKVQVFKLYSFQEYTRPEISDNGLVLDFMEFNLGKDENNNIHPTNTNITTRMQKR